MHDDSVVAVGLVLSSPSCFCTLENHEIICLHINDVSICIVGLWLLPSPTSLRSVIQRGLVWCSFTMFSVVLETIGQSELCRQD